MVKQVFTARASRRNDLGTVLDDERRLLRQFQFPHVFDDREGYLAVEHDRLLRLDPDHVLQCFKVHTNRVELIFHRWLEMESTSDEKVLAFLVEVMKADHASSWTGYRIMGAMCRNDFPIWSFEIFAKDPESGTLVYTGHDAPNVDRRKPRPVEMRRSH